MTSCLFIVYIWFGDVSLLSGEDQGFSPAPSRWELGTEGPASEGHPDIPEGGVLTVSIKAMCGYGGACGDVAARILAVPREKLGSEPA